MEKNTLDLKYEFISTAILLLIAIFLLPHLGLDESTIWLAGIIIGIAAITLVVIKVYIHQLKTNYYDVSRKLTQDFSNGSGLANSIAHKLSKMPEPNLTHAKAILAKAAKEIDKVEEGIILLNEVEYFDDIINEASVLDSTETMLAVNTFDERRFFNDPREKIYFEKNKEAVKHRNAIIQRIFVFDDRQIDTTEGKEKLKAVKLNLDNGIKTFVVLKLQLVGRSDLCVDWVMFGKSNSRLYVDYQDKIDETRVSYGELLINHDEIEKFKKNFKTLINMAISEAELKTLLNKLK